MKRKDFLRSIGAGTLLFNMSNLQALHRFASEQKNSEKMPVLFMGHGNPMNAIEENEFVLGFREQAANLPKPNAILCISAHWYTRGTFVTAMEKPKTIHDFGGFPKELFEVQYPAPGDPELALQTKELLKEKATIELTDEWGLDHGAWTVIMHLFPKADIPVIQLSIDYRKETQYHFELAQLLKSLRSKGILIIGSGNLVHNLGLVDFNAINKVDYGFDWAIEARSIINDYILNNNIKALLNYKHDKKALQLAIPTPDHFLPLIYSMGLKNDNDTIGLFNDKLLAGSLSMTSVKIS